MYKPNIFEKFEIRWNVVLDKTFQFLIFIFRPYVNLSFIILLLDNTKKLFIRFRQDKYRYIYIYIYFTFSWESYTINHVLISSKSDIFIGSYIPCIPVEAYEKT